MSDGPFFDHLNLGDVATIELWCDVFHPLLHLFLSVLHQPALIEVASSSEAKSDESLLRYSHDHLLHFSITCVLLILIFVLVLLVREEVVVDIGPWDDDFDAGDLHSNDVDP